MTDSLVLLGRPVVNIVMAAMERLHCQGAAGAATDEQLLRFLELQKGMHHVADPSWRYSLMTAQVPEPVRDELWRLSTRVLEGVASGKRGRATPFIFRKEIASAFVNPWGRGDMALLEKTATLKELRLDNSGQGTFRALFAPFLKVDKQGDYTLPGAFGRQDVVRN